MPGVSDDGIDGSVVGTRFFAPSSCQGALAQCRQAATSHAFCSVPKKDGDPLQGFFPFTGAMSGTRKSRLRVLFCRLAASLADCGKSLLSAFLGCCVSRYLCVACLAC